MSVLVVIESQQEKGSSAFEPFGGRFDEEEAKVMKGIMMEIRMLKVKVKIKLKMGKTELVKKQKEELKGTKKKKKVKKGRKKKHAQAMLKEKLK